MPHQRSRSSVSLPLSSLVAASGSNGAALPLPVPQGCATSYIDDLRPIGSRRGSAVATGSASCLEFTAPVIVAQVRKPTAPRSGGPQDHCSRRVVRYAPPKYPYRFANLLHLPTRIMHPERCAPAGWVAPAHNAESTPRKSEETLGRSSEVRTDTAFRVGQPRSFRKTAANQLRLQDVLENRHLPPLTREEFTDFLAFEALSIENWYFYAWLEGYTHQYAEWLASRQVAAESRDSNAFPVTSDNYDRYIAAHEKRATNTASRPEEANRAERRGSVSILRCESISPSDLPLHLSQSWSKALEAFFSPTSRFQLNLDADITVRIGLDARHSPDPSIFRPAKEAVEDMLNSSLNLYLRLRSGNAGRYRSVFAVFAGALFLIIGLALFAIVLAFRWPRAARVVSLPFLFLGPLTIVGGRYRTCLIMWMFGTCRQLRMCELVRPAQDKIVGQTDQDATAFVPPTNSLQPPKLAVDGKKKKPRRTSRNSRQSQQSAQIIMTGGRRVSTVTELDERRQASTAVTPLLPPVATMVSDSVARPVVPSNAITVTLPCPQHAVGMARGPSSESAKSEKSNVSGSAFQAIDTRLQSSFATYSLGADRQKSKTEAFPRPEYAGSLKRVWTAGSQEKSEHVDYSLANYNSRKESEYSEGASPVSAVAPWEEMEINLGAGTSRDSKCLEAACKPVRGQYSGSAPVWAGLTPVLSPEIARRQRDIMVTGSQYGLAVLLVIGAVVMSVPNPP